MTTTDYILDLVLIGLVFVQIRGRRLTTRSLLLPIGIVAYVAEQYLRSIPTAGNDLVLIVGCALAGITLGAGAALATKVTRDADGVPVAKAGLVAAVLWVLGVGSRFAFQMYSTHGGGPAVGRFMVHHDITSNQAWVAALVLMALGEALTRTLVLAYRGHVGSSRPVAPAVRPYSVMMGASDPVL